MSIETAVVFNYDMEPIYWRLGEGRSSVYIDDSIDLWNFLLQNKKDVYGVAHSHPGNGNPSPSYTDVTTFSACELGLGKRFLWPIITEDKVSFFMWLGPHKYDYKIVYFDGLNLLWLEKLRKHSYKK